MTFQFETLIQGAPTFQKHTEFMPAWNDMYAHVKARLAEGNMSFQELETTLWINVVNDEMEKVPILFYDARDRAIRDHGWTHT